MTNAKAAEVLRRHKQGVNGEQCGEMLLSELNSSINTAIAALEADHIGEANGMVTTPPTEEEIGAMFEKHMDLWAYDEDTQENSILAMSYHSFTAAVMELFQPK